MIRYQLLSSIYNENVSNVSNILQLIQGLLLFTIELSVELIKCLFGFSSSNVNSSISTVVDEFELANLQPSLSVNRVGSGHFDGKQKSFENYVYNPWLVTIVALLTVAILSYDLSKSREKKCESDQDIEPIKDVGLVEDNLPSEHQPMPKTFRTQRREIGLPYQDVTVSRSTPLSLLLWESK